MCRLTLRAPKIIQKVRESLTYIQELDAPVRDKVIAAYAQAVHSTQFYTIILTACALATSFLIKEKPLSK